jgi:hypothetical protein
MMSDGGKGSKPRPLSVDQSTFDNNFDSIFRQKDVLCDICGKNLNDKNNNCAYTACPLNWNEARMDIIGQNGPVGYE